MAATNNGESVLDEVLAFNADRKRRGVRRKLAAMDQGAFAFFRGANHLFGRAWERLGPPDPGPAIAICGDLHLENFGAFRAEDDTFHFDVNDFDEALVGPCGFDLVRCTASIFLAAEEWALSPLQAASMALAFLERYHKVLREGSSARDAWTPTPQLGLGGVWDLLGATAMGTQVDLLDRHTAITKDGSRRIVRSEKKHPPIRPKRAEEIRAAVQAYGDNRPDPRAYRVIDVTARVAGVGSLGLRRYTVLIAGGGNPDTNRLLDIKEVRPPSLRGLTKAPQPPSWDSDARRAVEAQRRLQDAPALGLDVIPIGDRAYRMREMIPDENRSSLDRLRKKPPKLRDAIEIAGLLTGSMHLRGCRREGDLDSVSALIAWAEGPALDAVLASAARFAERTQAEYDQFHDAYHTRPVPKPLRPKARARGAS